MENIEHIVQQPVKRAHKTPLLFQHGAWHGAWCWQTWMDYFASLGYEVHAISLPGHGKSSMNKGHINSYGFEDYVETLERQIKLISPAPVVIGHSLGGGIVQKYLENHQLPAAVLLASLPSKGMLPMTLRTLRRYPTSTLMALLKWDMYETVKTPALAQSMFLNATTEVDVEAFHKQLVREAIFFTLMKPFAKLNPAKTPMLALAAEKDAIFTLDEEKETAKKYDAQLVVFTGQAHNLMIESDWRKVADVIDGWITRDLALP